MLDGQEKKCSHGGAQSLLKRVKYASGKILGLGVLLSFYSLVLQVVTIYLVQGFASEQPPFVHIFLCIAAHVLRVLFVGIKLFVLVTLYTTIKCAGKAVELGTIRASFTQYLTILGFSPYWVDV